VGKDLHRVQQRIASASEKLFPPWKTWRELKKDTKLVQDYHLEVRGFWENGNAIADTYINETTSRCLKDRHYRQKREVKSLFNSDTGVYSQPPGMNSALFELIKASLAAGEGSSTARSTPSSGGVERKTSMNIWGFGGFLHFAANFVSDPLYSYFSVSRVHSKLFSDRYCQASTTIYSRR
jgi:hypothetical protein